MYGYRDININYLMHGTNRCSIWKWDSTIGIVSCTYDTSSNETCTNKSNDNYYHIDYGDNHDDYGFRVVLSTTGE